MYCDNIDAWQITVLIVISSCCLLYSALPLLYLRTMRPFVIKCSQMYDASDHPEIALGIHYLRLYIQIPLPSSQVLIDLCHSNIMKTRRCFHALWCHQCSSEASPSDLENVLWFHRGKIGVNFKDNICFSAFMSCFAGRSYLKRPVVNDGERGCTLPVWSLAGEIVQQDRMVEMMMNSEFSARCFPGHTLPYQSVNQEGGWKLMSVSAHAFDQIQINTSLDPMVHFRPRTSREQTLTGDIVNHILGR